jgi:CheY-like chemotaxis protein
VDFGLSKLIDASQDSQQSITRVGQILGTPQYMSPEQFEATETDARTDVYSLGATLFRLLTGQYPFGQCSSVVQVMTAHLTKAPPAPTQSVIGLPPICDQIVARAMAKKPEDRYQSAAALAQELDALLHRPLPMAPPTPVPSEQTLRTLQNVVIIEPSKLQGTILKSAFSQAGVSTVQLCTGLEAARKTLTQAPTDLLLTAMQLPDGSGLEFIREFLHTDNSSQTTVVLNSSASTLAELTNAGESACLILAPKKVRPEEIIRITHAASPCAIHAGPPAQPLNPATLRLQIILDSGRIPESLADSIRDLQLLDVEVLTATDSHSTSNATADLILLVQSASSRSESPDAAALARQRHASQSLCALLDSTGKQLRLRAVHRNDVIAICNQPLDSHRLACLLQAARP